MPVSLLTWNRMLFVPLRLISLSPHRMHNHVLSNRFGSMLLCCTAPSLAPPLKNDAAHSQGWRFAFYAVAVTSAAAAVAILALGTDPTPRRPAAASGKVRQRTLGLL